MVKMFSCPCYGYLTVSELPPGTYEICPVCNWEDDYVQFNNPDFCGGNNANSLNEAKKNYEEFGAASKKFIKNVRTPLPEEFP